jgi:hypothetical protein
MSSPNRELDKSVKILTINFKPFPAAISSLMNDPHVKRIVKMRVGRD